MTPFGDTVLLKDLTFTVAKGDHLMITGANGTGKTSILRVLSGIWPHFEGVIKKPHDKVDLIFYIPQRPYLAIGTLRDQIIYPHTQKDMIDAGRTDDELMTILKKVHLDYIPSREGGFDAIKEWKDVFSGGEKQRCQIARIFYHLPRFTVLDEATSAVSTDVEAILYKSLKEITTIITISHRPSLFKFHPCLLKVGEGPDNTGYNYSKMANVQSRVQSVQQEAIKLDRQIHELDGLAARLAEINAELSLGVQSEGTSNNIKRSILG